MEAVSGEPDKYRDTVHAFRDGSSKAKVHMELNMLRDAKGNKKGFYRYTSSKSRLAKIWACC